MRAHIRSAHLSGDGTQQNAGSSPTSSTALRAASKGGGIAPLSMSRVCIFFFSSRRRHTRLQGDWSSDVCSSDLVLGERAVAIHADDAGVLADVAVPGTALEAVSAHDMALGGHQLAWPKLGDAIEIGRGAGRGRG